ncbi:SixA phosphatase family protein [Caulobacter sp. DWR2-3-1b2]|uniref:SixA phosphatase family protein n=1 Tax=unclassified Caulobacter TaxID=2648921 RepID=UPI003CF20504
MDRLILMRHGKAEQHAASGGDFERALAPRGQSDAALMGKVLAKAGLAPDLALVSSARRTRETWDAAGPAFPKARAEPRRDLYHAEAQDVLAAIREGAPDSGTVMVVGHNPGLHELALRMAMGAAADPALLAKLRGKFPTSTVAVFSIDTDGAPTLSHLFYASENGGQGGE